MLTKQDILSKISEREIMQTYFILAGGSKCEILYPTGNPFRNDKTPTSARFYYNNSGTLMYIDNADKKYYGDCFSMVSWYLESIGKKNDFISVLKEIDERFNLNLYPNSFNKKNNTKNVKVIAKTKINNLNSTIFRKNTEFITTSYKHFTKEQLEYFNEYHIHENTLKLLNVEGVSTFYYGLKHSYKKWENTKHNPIYKYTIIPYNLIDNKLTKLNEKYIQVYRPKAIRKNEKFKTNAKGSPLMNFDYVYNNINSLSRDIVVITSSMKDVLVWHELNVHAVCPIGEGTNIPTYYLDWLEENFKHIIINYDNDNAGTKATNQLIKKRPNFSVFYLDEKHKEISEYVKNIGLNESFKNISSLLYDLYDVELLPF